MRVLQVEDDPTTAQSVEQMLKSEGYECHTTARGEDAVELAQKNPYDVILLDIMLPDIDGYEVLKRLQDWAIGTPVVIQSGMVEDQRDAAGLGFAECLVKPFTKEQLKARIESAMGRAQHATASQPADGGDSSTDRRQAPRTRLIKSAQIFYDDNKCLMDCIVLSLSDGGAALQPEDTLNLPEKFELQIKFGARHDCHVCWVHGNKLGVRFLDV
ncbi:MAG: response regulator [Kiloniellales bacterium]|jgi:DNA-binding response OmpR family regulator